MDLVLNNLFIGNAGDAKSPDVLYKNGICSVFNVALDLNYDLSKLGVAFADQYHVGLTDGLNNPPELFYAALFTLRGLMSKSHPILIHCHEGRSRSPTIVATYMTLTQGGTIVENLAKLKTIRAKVAPEAGMIQFAEQCLPHLQKIW